MLSHHNLVSFLLLILVLNSPLLPRADDYLYQDYQDPSELSEYGIDQQLLGTADCSQNECGVHRMTKRLIQNPEIPTMKDFIKYLLRGSLTKEDQQSTEPFVAGNMTLGTYTLHIFPFIFSILFEKCNRNDTINS